MKRFMFPVEGIQKYLILINCSIVWILYSLRDFKFLNITWFNKDFILCPHDSIPKRWRNDGNGTWKITNNSLYMDVFRFVLLQGKKCLETMRINWRHFWARASRDYFISLWGNYSKHSIWRWYWQNYPHRKSGRILK